MILPAEWSKQSAIQLTWPDEETEWEPDLDNVLDCYLEIVENIVKHERLIIVCRNIAKTKAILKKRQIDTKRIIFSEIELNDTWARDHGAISVIGENGEKAILDFVFNGWGLKFHADLDNQITRHMFENGIFADDVYRVSLQPFVLEGGSIDSDGEGTLLATSECLLSKNRNEYLNRQEIEEKLKMYFGLKRILWVDHGHIDGDDTDSHIDTLVRFCSPDTIAYTQCTDKEDDHYEDLKKMEKQLKTFKTLTGKNYKLIPLPLPKPMYLDDYRLPATYANFLIMNDVVLMPGTGDDLDKTATKKLQSAFPNRKVICINCKALLSGHGSLHCITMQFPEGFIKTK